MKVKSESEVAQSCPTLSDPVDCSLPGSSIHGIFQARVLEWGAIAFSNSNSTLIKINFKKFYKKYYKVRNEKDPPPYFNLWLLDLVTSSLLSNIYRDKI